MWKLSSAFFHKRKTNREAVEKYLADKQKQLQLIAFAQFSLSSPVAASRPRDVLTQISAHVNIKVNAIVRVVDEVAVCDFDERVQVVFFSIRIKDIAGNLEDNRKTI